MADDLRGAERQLPFHLSSNERRVSAVNKMQHLVVYVTLKNAQKIAQNMGPMYTIKAILNWIEIHRATFNAAPLKPLGNARNQRDLDAIERTNKVDLISR